METTCRFCFRSDRLKLVPKVARTLKPRNVCIEQKHTLEIQNFGSDPKFIFDN